MLWFLLLWYPFFKRILQNTQAIFCSGKKNYESATKRESNRLRLNERPDAVHFVHQKTNEVITQEKTVWKCFLKI